MPTRNVSLPEKLDQFITAKVEAGDYANASEVMRTACVCWSGKSGVRGEDGGAQGAIAEGIASGDAEPGVFERLDAYIDELAAAKGERVA